MTLDTDCSWISSLAYLYRVYLQVYLRHTHR